MPPRPRSRSRSISRRSPTSRAHRSDSERPVRRELLLRDRRSDARVRDHRSRGGGGNDRPQAAGRRRPARRDLADPRAHRSRDRRPAAQGRYGRRDPPASGGPPAVRPRAGAGVRLRPARRAAARPGPRAGPRRRAANRRPRLPCASRAGPFTRQRRVRGPGGGVRRRRPVSGIDRADRPARRRLRYLGEERRARVAYAARFDHRVQRAWTGNHHRTRAPRQSLPHRRLPPRLGRGPAACAAAPRCDPSRRDVRAPARIAALSIRWATAPTEPMTHLLALALLGVDCLVRAWRIQIAVWTAGGRLSFRDAFRLNLYGEAASQLTPNRLGGEPARFLGLHEAGLRPVTAIVAIGVEVACEWPVFVFAAGALVAYYVPDWQDAARVWLRHHRAGELVTIEITVLLILVTVYLLQRLVRSGFVSHRVRRQWRVAWAHVRRAPFWALGAGALLTVVSIAARALILPALAWGMPHAPPFAQMFFGALTLLHAPLVVPLPSGGGGLEVAFLNGFAGDFGAAQVRILLWWRFYTALLLTALGVAVLVRQLGYRAAVELFKIGWGKSRSTPPVTPRHPRRVRKRLRE